MSRKNLLYVVVGASRGIGAAVTEHLVASGATVLGVSRSPAVAGTWIEADLTNPAGIDTVVNATRGKAIDALLFLGGSWERGAFTDQYTFAESSGAEIRAVIELNLVAPILLAQALAPDLAKAPRPRIVLMGSLSGLPNQASREVANTAAKFGLQGVAQALNLSLRELQIGVSVVNPGNVATTEVQADIAAGRFEDQVPIALDDIVRTIDYLLSVGASAVPTEINLAQLQPEC